MDIGALLREARWKAELSQRVLAHRAGVTQGSVSRWETGAVLPGLADVDKVLAACGLQLEGSLVTLHAHLHAKFARLAAHDVEARFREHYLLAGILIGQLSDVSQDVVVCGGLAAAAHGIPVDRLQGDLLLPDDDEALGRVVAALRLCHPQIVLDGARFGVDLSVALFRRRPVCDWWCQQVEFTTRVLGTGGARPATTVLGWREGQLVVQAAAAIEPDAVVRAEVLGQWRAWQSTRAMGAHSPGDVT